MPKLSNIRIGMKLAIMSGISVLLVAAMLGSQLLGGAAVQRANEDAVRRAKLVQSTLDAKASIRGMAIGVRDIRLARSGEDITKAQAYFNDRHASAKAYIGQALSYTSIPATAETLKQIASQSDQYEAGAKEIIALKTEQVALEAGRRDGGALPAEAAKRLAALEEQIGKMVSSRTLPLAGQMEDSISKVVTGVKQRMETSAAQSAQAMVWSERLGLGVGAAVILMLIASAVLGAILIAKPLRKLAGVLVELTNDRIVEVPYATQGDEIGEIARAADVFKQSIGEKVINLRVRAALDVVKSNVMVSDSDFNIIYMNNTLQEMLREAEPELRKELPNFEAGKLVGVNMDVFHKNPAHQRQLMDGLTGTRESKIAIGTQKFQHIATPVTDTHGQRVGVVVEWRNETVEKAIESEVDDLVKAAVAGDFSKRVPLEGKKDFMLNLATAMNSLCDNTGSALDDLIHMLDALAEGDLTKRITADYNGNFATLKDNANKTAERIGATIGEIKASAAEVTNASAEISGSTTDLSQRTEEQAASLEETSASMEEISATVKKNAENAQAANASASETRVVADRGGQVVAQAVQAMAKIEESSRKISDIIGVIDEIARQTNLLALNAAVEAARAGEAGRGFAVVASEVRSLAQRSSQAAKDIKDLITNSNGQVKDGVELVNKAGASLTEIVDSIKKVAEIVADIANASAEQASGIEQVNKALNQMDEVTQQNSALVEENAATAKTLEEQALAMNDRVAYFQFIESTGGAAGIDLDAAIKKHSEWKVKLRAAMTHHQKLDPAEIAKDHCCQLGQWLYGDGKSEFGVEREFQSLVGLHKAFHCEAAKVAELINDKKYDEAESALNSGTSYAHATNEVRNAILALKTLQAA